MRWYKVHVEGFHKYYFERHIEVEAGSESSAAAKAIKEFWKDPINKKRKRKTQYLKLKIYIKPNGQD